MAPLAKNEDGKTTVQEGERVFTIGSPLTLNKILTTGVVSKVEAHTLLSDVNINPGNSGGPLFNSAGKVIGLTTFGERSSSGPGVSGIVRIEDAIQLIEQNRAKATGVAPSSALLPVEPVKPFPLEGLKAALVPDKYDYKSYFVNDGDFEIEFSTPSREYRDQEERRLVAEKARSKRQKKQGQEADATSTEEAPKNWESDAGGHKATVEILVFPKAKEGFWNGMKRSAAASSGVYVPPTLKFKTDFYRMRLLCGDKEIAPIHPGKIPAAFALKNANVNITDEAAFGDYTYPPDAISPNCHEQRLEIFPARTPLSRSSKSSTLKRSIDFESDRSLRAAPDTPASSKTDGCRKSHGQSKGVTDSPERKVKLRSGHFSYDVRVNQQPVQRHYLRVQRIEFDL